MKKQRQTSKSTKKHSRHKAATKEEIAKDMETSEDEMPPARVVVEQRAREAAGLLALQVEEDSVGDFSDKEVELASGLAALEVPSKTPPAALPDAASLVARLATALPKKRDTCFLDEYLRILNSHNDQRVRIITDKLMQCIEHMLVTEGPHALGSATCSVRADSVVLAGWLSLAALWREPRVSAAPRALHAILRELPVAQVEELADGLYKTLQKPGEFVLLSDTVRSAAVRDVTMGIGARPGVAGGGRALTWAQGGGAAAGGTRALAELLLRGALAQLTGAGAEAPPPRWTAGSLSVREVKEALVTCWEQLEAEEQLLAARLVGRVLVSAVGAGGGGAVDVVEAECNDLLTMLAHPPPPKLRHRADYLKVTVAVDRLRKLYTNTCRNEKKNT